MKKIGLFLLLGVSFSWLVSACQGCQQERRKEVPLDSIVLSDPCILADRKTAMYYMTGTGGMLWKSKDLKLWEGPFHVAKTDSGSWMGPKPMIWAAELHPYKGKYYYFATFTNQEVKIDTVQGNVIERRASHVLVSDNPDGPYVPMKDSTYHPRLATIHNNIPYKAFRPYPPRKSHPRLVYQQAGKWNHRRREIAVPCQRIAVEP